MPPGSNGLFSAGHEYRQKAGQPDDGFQTDPASLELLYQLAHFAVFRKLKERLGFDRIRVAYSGAAPIAPEILHFFHSIGVNLVEGYGQTEGTGVTTTSKIGEGEIRNRGSPLGRGTD